MMHKKLKPTALIFSLFLFIYSSGSENKDDKKTRALFITTELGVYKGTGFSTDFPYFRFVGKGYAKSLRFVAGYFLNPHFSAGVGFGADRFEIPGANTFPLFLDLRGYIKDARNTPFVFLDAGKTVVFNSQAQEGGPLVDGGAGYKFFVGKKACVIAKAGYNYFKNKDFLWLSTDTDSMEPDADTYRWFYLKRQSATFSIGLLF